VTVPTSPHDIAALCAVAVAGGIAAVWVFDTVANCNVRRRAEREGREVDLPPARNLFAQDPPHWSAVLLTALVAFAATKGGD